MGGIEEYSRFDVFFLLFFAFGLCYVTTYAIAECISPVPLSFLPLIFFNPTQEPSGRTERNEG